jgi:excisionase family DNA binding protein
MKPKSIADLVTWLRKEYDALAHLDKYGPPDDADESFFVGLEVADIVGNAQRVASEFGAPAYEVPPKPTPREGMTAVGRLVRWAQDESPSEVFTVTEAARHLKVKTDTVRSWINSGRLKAANTGAGSRPRWRIAWDDLDRFLAGRSREPAPKPSKRRVPKSTKQYFPER